jgi:CheY-like chemotaxis protein
MATSSHRVLLLWDDPAVQAAMLGALEAAGLETVGAADPTQAVDVLTNRRIDVVVADYHLPGTVGLELLAVIRGTAPATRLILYSGEMTAELAAEARAFEVHRVLDKPVSGEKLVEAVQAAVAPPRPPEAPVAVPEPALEDGVERPWRLIVVQRTHRPVLQGILQNPDHWPPRSAVMPDRRHRERRLRLRQVAIDRRRTQRRAEPHALWYTHGFIVVETPGPPTEAIQLNASRA